LVLASSKVRVLDVDDIRPAHFSCKVRSILPSVICHVSLR
jgi:hypothetical protein